MVKDFSADKRFEYNQELLTKDSEIEMIQHKRDSLLWEE